MDPQLGQAAVIRCYSFVPIRRLAEVVRSGPIVYRTIGVALFHDIASERKQRSDGLGARCVNRAGWRRWGSERSVTDLTKHVVCVISRDNYSELGRRFF